RGRQQIQPLHLDDLVTVLVRLVEGPAIPGLLDAVGPRPLALRDYLATFKRAMGTGGVLLATPMWLARAAAALGARAWPRAPLDPDALAMLARGSVADPAPMARVRGPAPRQPAAAFAAASPKPSSRESML